MKKNVYFTFVILLFLLSGCNYNAGSPASDNISVPDSVIPTAKSDVISAYQQSISEGRDFVGCDGKIYFINSGYLNVLDQSAGKVETICHKDGCPHDIETCDAYMMGSQILPTTDKLYYFYNKNGKTILASCGLYGENKQDVVPLWDATPSGPVYNAFLTTGHIYCSRLTPDSSQIFDINLNSNTVGIIANKENKAGVFTHLLDVVDGIVYYQEDHADKTLANGLDPTITDFINFRYPGWYESYSKDTVLYAQSPEKTIKLQDNLKGSSWSNGCNGCVYYVSEDKHTLYQYDLVAAKRHVVLSGEEDYSINENTYDNIISVSSRKAGDVVPQVLICTLSENGNNPKEFSLAWFSQERKFFDLYRIAALTDQYLISYSLVDDYNKSRTDFGYAFISKETFRQANWNIDDMIRIAEPF